MFFTELYAGELKLNLKKNNILYTKYVLLFGGGGGGGDLIRVECLLPLLSFMLHPGV